MLDLPRSDEIALTDAALRMRMPYPTAYKLMFRGELSGRRVAGRFYVALRDVERLLAERHNHAPSAA